MAITIVEVAELQNNADQNDYAVSAYTPTANTVQVAFVSMAGSDGTSVGTFDDSEGAWTLIRNNVFDVNKMEYAFYRKVGGSPVSITPTFHSPSDAGTGCGIWIVEVDPDTMPSGNPIRQHSYSSGVSTTDYTFTYSSNLLTGNGYAAFCRNNTNPAGVTSPASWTEGMDTGHATPNAGYWGGFRAGGETGTSFTPTGPNGSYGIIAVEVWNEEPPTKLAVSPPRQTKLDYKVSYRNRVIGLRGGVSQGLAPSGGAAPAATGVLRNKAITKSRAQMVREAADSRRISALNILGEPIGSIVVVVGNEAFDIILRRRMVRR